MRRLLIGVPLVLCAALLWVAWEGLSGPRAGRTAPAPRPGVPRPAGESWRVVEESWPEAGGELARPAVLRGAVYDGNGRPVRRATVAWIRPRPMHLVHTDERGEYALRFERAGRYLVEAHLHLDLGRRRVVVEVDGNGDPPPLDFHLEPTGQVFGEVVVGEDPVLDGGVSLHVVDLFGDAELAEDTDVDNGFFNFYWAPPEGVPLRLIVESLEGYMDEPRALTYRGEPIDLGRIRLKRYPTLRVRMRLPDGRWAGDVEACVRADFQPDGRGEHVMRRRIGWASTVIVQEKASTLRRLVLRSEGSGHTLIRDVEMVLDQLREREVVVRPGPFPVRGRLVDEHGRPVVARFEVAGRSVETGPDAYFSVDVPHGGAFGARVTALRVDRHGWLPLVESPRAVFLLDADAPGDVRFPLGGRLLFVAAEQVSVRVHPEGGGRRVASGDLVEAPDGAAGLLLDPVPPGRYRWTRGVRRERTYGERTFAFFEHPEAAQGASVDVRDELVVIDLR